MVGSLHLGGCLGLCMAIAGTSGFLGAGLTLLIRRYRTDSVVGCALLWAVVMGLLGLGWIGRLLDVCRRRILRIY